jgi:membrane-bound serine protease (ClpP class)
MLTADPNVVYLILIVGLWASALAVYIPGTGVPEGIALVVLSAALFLLAALPTNWLAVLALVVGILGFLLVPLYKQHLSALALVGLAFQVAGSIFLFNGLTVSWLIIAISAAMSLAFYQFVLLPAREIRNRQPVLGDEQLLPGASGRVVMGINPIGTVNVRGELWTAYSDQPLQTGDEVVVVEKQGLQLHVEKVKTKRGSQRSVREAD